MLIIEESEEKKQIVPITVANEILFVFVLLTLFFVPFIPLPYHHIAYNILFTTIFLAGTQLISKNKTLIMAIGILAIAFGWISIAIDFKVIIGISKVINVVLFIFIVLDLVKQVSRAKKVSPKIILESVNGYLLIGMVFSVLVAFLMSIDHGSFSFDKINVGNIQTEIPFHQCIYFAFITLTTVGYGDVIPLTPPARSLAMLIGVTGQLYIALVIALLVGKYISQKGVQ